VEQDLINAILDSYIQGVSTRKVRHIMEKFGATGVSAETVSRFRKALDEKVNKFLNRPIEQLIVYLIVDAVYVKVRHHSRYVNTTLGYFRYDRKNKTTDNCRNSHPKKTFRIQLGEMDLNIPTGYIRHVSLNTASL